MTEQSLLSKFHHIGILVNDLEKAVQHYESMGIGPFNPMIPPKMERMMYGKPIDEVKLKVRTAQIGPVRIELIEPGKDKGYFWREFLEKKGEGVNHLAFAVDDIERAQAELVRKGNKVIYTARHSKGGATYLKTDEVGGLLLELIQTS